MAPAVLVASELRKLNFEYKNEFGVQGLEKCAWACRRSLCRLAQQVTARNLFARGAAPSPGWWRGAALAARGVGRPRVHAFETYGACMHCSIERNQLSTLRILASPPSKCFPHRRHLCGPRSRLRERCGAGHCARLCRTFSRFGRRTSPACEGAGHNCAFGAGLALRVHLLLTFYVAGSPAVCSSGMPPPRRLFLRGGNHLRCLVVCCSCGALVCKARRGSRRGRALFSCVAASHGSRRRIAVGRALLNRLMFGPGLAARRWYVCSRAGSARTDGARVQLCTALGRASLGMTYLDMLHYPRLRERI